MRRSRTQSDITSALDAPPLEDLTRPEVHLPVDVPPDDLTEMHSVYGVRLSVRAEGRLVRERDRVLVAAFVHRVRLGEVVGRHVHREVELGAREVIHRR